MRSIIEKRIDGCRLVVTMHHPAEDARAEPRIRVGIIFFNSGFLPRTAAGDLFVHLADEFAAEGYPSFRADLPGLGDSEGDLPADTQNLFAALTRGSHGRAAGLLSSELVQDHKLHGMILAGLCGGAVTALFAAMGEGRAACRGIIQLDPSFVLVPPLEIAATCKPGGTMAAQRAPRRRARDAYAKARVAFLQTRIGEFTHRAYSAVKPALVFVPKLVRRLRGPRVPANANLRILNGWIDLLRGGMPMLTFMAGDQAKRTEKFDYLARINAACRTSRHKVVWIPDTTHSFVEGSGKSRTARECITWLRTTFPRVDAANRTVHAP